MEWQWRLDSNQHYPGNNRASYRLEDTTMELTTGFEPVFPSYELGVLPLN